MNDGLAGLVLAGGKSTRLGMDKVGLPFSGETLLSRTVGLARERCRDVYVSGRDPAGLEFDCPWIADEVAGIGPMGGILTGLRQIGRPLLVLACDMPLLDGAVLSCLVKERAARPQNAVMTTFRQIETGFIESLVAIYEPEAAPFLNLARESGVYQLSRAIPKEMVHHLDYGQSEASVFFNINYPADLAVLRRVTALECANARVQEVA